MHESGRDFLLENRCDLVDVFLVLGRRLSALAARRLGNGVSYCPELLRFDCVDILSDKVFKHRVYGCLITTAWDGERARSIPGQVLGQNRGDRVIEGVVFPERNTGGLVGVVLELDAPPWCLLALEIRLEKIEEIAADLETKLSNGIGSVHA